MTNERQRSESLSTGPAGFSDQFDSSTAIADGHVEVIHGVYAHNLPYGGASVARARDELAERMNIDPQAIAVINGSQVPEDTILREGDVLNFVKPAGEKGFVFC